MASAKSFDISKQLVWRVYQRVKANNGAAGVDKISLFTFEQNLKGNLYKIWIRMSSGSYMPPPVQQVNIPKKDGGTRSLGVRSHCVRSHRSDGGQDTKRDRYR